MKNIRIRIKIMIWTVLLQTSGLKAFSQGEFIVEFDLDNETFIKTGPKIDGLTKIYQQERAYDENTGRYILPSSVSSDDGQRLYTIETSDATTVNNPPITLRSSTFQFDKSTNTLFGIEQDNPNNKKYLVSVNQATGALTRIGNGITGSSVYGGNRSALDRTNDIFTFVTPSPSAAQSLYSLNTTTGNLVYSPALDLETGVDSENLLCIEYDNSTEDLFGLLQDNSDDKFYLVKIDPSDATITRIGNGSIDGSSNCSGTIDEVNQKYIILYQYIGTSNYAIVELDLATGNQLNKVEMSVTQHPDNLFGIEYDHVQEKLFGFHWESFTYDEPETAWERTSGPPNGSIRALAAIGTNIFAASSGGVYVTTDEGDNWTQRNGTIQDLEANSMTVSGNNLFVGTSNGEIFVSSDLGMSWNDISPNYITSTNNVHALVVTSSHIFASIDGEGVQKSTLSGINSATWTEFSEDLDYNGMRSLFIKGTDIYAGTFGAGVWKSPVSSENWTMTATTSAGTTAGVQAIEANSTTMFVGSAIGTPVLFHSSNNGTTWEASSTAVFDNKPVYAITHDDEDYVYSGTEGAGVLISTDNGENWAEFNRGFRNASGDWHCNQINIRSFVISGDYIYAGTDCGIWKRSMEALSSVTELDQTKLIVFPNPTNRYLKVDKQTDLHYSISNMLGKQVLTGKLEGSNSTIDLVKLKQGVYVVTLLDGLNQSFHKILKN